MLLIRGMALIGSYSRSVGVTIVQFGQRSALRTGIALEQRIVGIAFDLGHASILDRGQHAAMRGTEPADRWDRDDTCWRRRDGRTKHLLHPYTPRRTACASTRPPSKMRP
jgi:hypothetical protein